MKPILAALASALMLASPTVAPNLASADSAVPERRLILSRDVDFYGSDLQALFDTNYGA